MNISFYENVFLQLSANSHRPLHHVTNGLHTHTRFHFMLYISYAHLAASHMTTGCVTSAASVVKAKDAVTRLCASP